MTVTVGSYSLCDGTLAGGVAVSDLNLNQRRISDIVPVLPKPYRVSLGDHGTGYSVGDALTITDGTGSAAIRVTVIGAGGAIVNFFVGSNTFQANGTLAATGGTGTGATFGVSSGAQPNMSNPQTYDRSGRPCVYSFTVKRTHADAESADEFIIGLEDAIPSVGSITVTTTGPTPRTFVIPNGKVQSHSLTQQQGATTFHQYSIVGGSAI